MAKRRLLLWALGIAMPLILAIALVVGAMLVVGALGGATGAMDEASNTGSNPGSGGATCQVDPYAITVSTVGPYGRSGAPGDPMDQLYNAAVIIAVGASRGLSQRDQQIALMAAMQESALRNLDYGDADSLGLFQQRPSQGWGTPDEIMDPAYAAGAFYDKLVAVADRGTMTLNDAAQAVQISGYPDAYGPHEDDALTVLQAIYGDSAAVVCADLGAGMTQAQADSFMDAYRNADAAEWDIRSCGCDGGCLVNCVSFSVYFINRYTTQHVNAATGDGRDVAGNMAAWWGLPTSHVPQVYAIFSRSTGSMYCDGSPCGHTGVVLGIDAPNDTIIIGEAGCGNPGFTGAHAYSLSDWSTDAYTYAYTDTILKGDPSADY